MLIQNPQHLRKSVLVRCHFECSYCDFKLLCTIATLTLTLVDGDYCRLSVSKLAQCQSFYATYRNKCLFGKHYDGNEVKRVLEELPRPTYGFPALSFIIYQARLVGDNTCTGIPRGLALHTVASQYKYRTAWSFNCQSTSVSKLLITRL